LASGEIDRSMTGRSVPIMVVWLAVEQFSSEMILNDQGGHGALAQRRIFE
jgi:hypothetical protein